MRVQDRSFHAAVTFTRAPLLHAAALALVFGAAPAEAWTPQAGAAPAAETVADASRTRPDDPRAILRRICGDHPQEPACREIDALPAADSFLLVRAHCGSPAAAGSEPCQDFSRLPVTILSLSMPDGTWRASRGGRQVGVDVDRQGLPTLRIRPRDAATVVVVLDGISPLTYTATAGPPKEEDLSIVAGLKAFLALAGTGIQALVQTVAFTPPPVPGAPPGISPAPAGTEGFKGASCSPAPRLSAQAALLGERHRLLSALHLELRGLERALEEHERVRGAFLAVLQAADRGRPLAPEDLRPIDTSALDAAFTRLEAAYGALRTQTDTLASCQPLLSMALALLSAPGEPAVLAQMAEGVNAAPACAAPLAAFGREVAANAAALADAAAEPSCAGKLDGMMKLHAAASRPILERLLNARQVEDRAWQAIERALGSKAQILGGARTLAAQAAAARRRTWRGALVRSILVARRPAPLGWKQAQTHTVVLRAHSPYVKELSLAYGPEEKHVFRLESTAGRILGFGAGLIYTPLHDSEWSAVTLPGTGARVIAETARETRAGDIAAFLIYRFMDHAGVEATVAPVLEAGIGVTSDRPAFFLGPAVEVGRTLRLGAGWSPQRVEKLAPGLAAGNPIPSADVIRTRRVFETGNWYVSLSVALDGLPLFGK